LPTVLAVDDEEFILDGYRRGFGHTHEVFTATNSAEALRIARAVKPSLAVVDLVLGDESGIELVMRLRAVLPRVTIVMASGYLSTGTTVAAVKAGADFVVHKPTTARRILAEIAQGSKLVDPVAEKMPSLRRAE